MPQKRKTPTRRADSSAPAARPSAEVAFAGSFIKKAAIGIVVLLLVFACLGTAGIGPDPLGLNLKLGRVLGFGPSYHVSLIAVGDNLPDDDICYYAEEVASERGTGDYDYTAIYEHIKPTIEAADLAIVTEETHLGGSEIGPEDYPSFNVTDEMADAIVDAGFDVVALAGNHSYDWGYYGGAEHNVAVWAEQPVIAVGAYNDEASSQVIATKEINGITFSFLDYTYGINGYDQGDLPDYTVIYLDEDRVRADVPAAREISDVVIVIVHWGTENTTELNEDQEYYAELFADLGVDLVIGSHPHVIQDMEWVTGEAGNETLVVYSLGNFLSNHQDPKPMNELEGMLSCSFVKDPEADTVAIEDVSFIPLVNHTDKDGSFSIYRLKDYTNELAARHTVLSELDDAVAWLKEETESRVTGFDLDMEVGK